MDYDKHPPLTESALSPDPLAQLARWLTDAEAAGQIEPTAMTLATVGAEGKPSARLVLYKGAHDGALTFYTSYESRKGAELAQQPQAALVFWWDRLERQVRAEGRVLKLPTEMSERYFHSRPRLSQLAAFTSRQSQPVSSRAELDARLAENEKKFAGGEVPRPDCWGGYALVPELFEFWQGRRGRLHDRLVYRRTAGTGWKIERLEP
jgi:pyridoxamine 5'-phosphate oxidase